MVLARSAPLITPDLVTPGLVTPGLITPGLITPEMDQQRHKDQATAEQRRGIGTLVEQQPDPKWAERCFKCAQQGGLARGQNLGAPGIAHDADAGSDRTRRARRCPAAPPRGVPQSGTASAHFPDAAQPPCSP
ncbi:MAG: hypothetical protein IPK59_13370 [Rhodospirillaceae bacterium]|nr:hypothetical protein [Rhodospirillaceae bacterium]